MPSAPDSAATTSATLTCRSPATSAHTKAAAAAASSTAAIASGERLRRMAGLMVDTPRKTSAGIGDQCIA